MSQKKTGPLIGGTLLACVISTAVVGCGGFGVSDGPVTEFQTETVTVPGEWLAVDTDVGIVSIIEHLAVDDLACERRL